MTLGRTFAQRWDGNETTIVNATIVAVLVLAAASWVRPVGLDGLPVVVLVLLILNCLALTVRLVPDGWTTERGVFGWLAAAGAAAAALLMLTLSGFAFAFAAMAVGHAGFRLRPRWALALGVGVSVLCTAALLLAPRFGNERWPWYFGLPCGAAVLVGLYNRIRSQSLRSARVAAEQALRAAESEGREQALAERARIARDIHDVLAHSLSGVNMQLQLADALLGAGAGERAHDAVRRAQSLAREGMVEARRAVQALREDALSLPDALAAMVTGEADLEVTGDVQALPGPVAQVLVRAAQEGLTNARRHAAGSDTYVHLRCVEDRVELEVTNGPAGGSGVPSPPGSGMGLVGMRERAALRGGVVTAGPIVDGPLSGGWRTAVVIPR